MFWNLSSLFPGAIVVTAIKEKGTAGSEESFLLNFHSLFNPIINSLVVLKSQGKLNSNFFGTNFLPSEEISQNTVAIRIMTDLEMEEDREGRELEDSTEISDILSIEDDMESLESLEISEIYEEIQESIESLDSLEINDLNSTLSSTIIQEDCGDDPCSFIFADSTLTDQAVGKS